ncbi:MAG: low temperature requirement protein A [Chloroflexi bacterium]|nr:low temperature requirement protein A [Chloroflexota bacterium]
MQPQIKEHTHGTAHALVDQSEQELRVSTLELFFDLVFVFTITQLASLLARDLSAAAAAQVCLIFIVLFWMYGGYAWLTNQVPPVSTMRRVLLIAGMAAFFVCALSVPRAFSGTGLVFGVGYLLVVLVHGGLYAQVHGRAVLRFVPFNAAGAACIIIASQLNGALVYVLWAAPIALQYAASYLAGRVGENQRAGFDVRPGHFVERHGGLLIVAFGESVVGVGIGLADLTLDLKTVITAVLGLVLAAALWWVYFGSDEKQAEAHLRAAAMNDRVRMALVGYFYAFVPMLLGVTSLAAGVKLTISTIDARLSLGPALLLGGGVALYLVGDSIFRRTMRIPGSVYRLSAAAVAAATVVLGTMLAGLAQLLGLLLTVAAMLVLEARNR